MILVLLVYFLFASTFTLGKAVLSYCDPILFIGIRMTLAGVILLAIAFMRGQWGTITRSNRLLYFHIIMFHIYCAYVFEFWALQYVTSSKTALIYNFSPFITALLSYGIFRDTEQHLTVKKIIGLCIGAVGMIFWLISQDPGHTGFSILFISGPELALLFAVTSAAYGWIVMRTLIVQHAATPLFINGYGMLGGGLLAFITSFIFEGMPHLKIPEVYGYNSGIQEYLVTVFGPYYTAWLFFLGYLILLIIIANGICYNLYGVLLKKYSATLLSFAGFTCPLFAALLGWFFHGETTSYHFIVTVSSIFMGLYIFYQDELYFDYLIKK